MNVATTYQLKKMVIVQNFKRLMFKAICNSHQHLYSGKQKDIFRDYYEATKEEDTKNTLKLSFNLFEILIKEFLKIVLVS